MILHGVDFSGGDQPGGKIWVATRDGRRPVALRRGFDHHALVELIAASASDGRPHLWRIDAPFAVAIETLAAHGIDPTWSAMSTWLGSFGTPREWRSACRGLDRAEPRRATDREARTPMAPQNLRVFKQTWSAITRILVPLAARGVRIEPVAGPRTACVVVAEGCPASALHARGWPVRGYKGAGQPPMQRRREIVAGLRREKVDIAPAAAQMAIDDTEGDGVDALLLVANPTQTVVPQEGMAEAWVY
ncbi:MAG: DUF429 domain-containing protein [Phycisphaerales bacterium]